MAYPNNDNDNTNHNGEPSECFEVFGEYDYWVQVTFEQVTNVINWLQSFVT